MPKKPNYDFEKRRKELERQKKKEAKREDRARRKSEGPDESGAEPIAVDGDQEQSTTV